MTSHNSLKRPAEASASYSQLHPMKRTKQQHSRYEDIELDFVLELVYKYGLSNAEVVGLYKAVFSHKAGETFGNKQVQYIKQNHGTKGENNTPSEGQEFIKLHGKLTPSAKSLIAKLMLSPANPALQAAFKVLHSSVEPMEPNIPGFTASDSAPILLLDSESEGDDESSADQSLTPGQGLVDMPLPPVKGEGSVVPPVQAAPGMVPPQPEQDNTMAPVVLGTIPPVVGYEGYGILGYIALQIDQHQGNEFYKTHASDPAFNPSLPNSPFHGMTMQRIGFQNMLLEHYAISELSHQLYALQHGLPILQ